MLCRSLGTGAFRESIFQMLDRDPSKRPTVPQLINTWSSVFPCPIAQRASMNGRRGDELDPPVLMQPHLSMAKVSDRGSNSNRPDPIPEHATMLATNQQCADEGPNSGQSFGRDGLDGSSGQLPLPPSLPLWADFVPTEEDQKVSVQNDQMQPNSEPVFGRGVQLEQNAPVQNNPSPVHHQMQAYTEPVGGRVQLQHS